jgi:hypothetical protein
MMREFRQNGGSPEMICDGYFFTSAQAGGLSEDFVLTVSIMSCCAAGDSQFGAQAAMALSLDAFLTSGRVFHKVTVAKTVTLTDLRQGSLPASPRYGIYV